jgi:hypothetical protein
VPEPEPGRGRPDGAAPVRPLRGGDDRGVWLALIVVAVALVVALVKPWAAIPAGPAGGAADGAPNRGGRATRSPVPSPTPTPTDPYAELVVTCGNPSGWRVATLQTWVGRATPIRTWLAVDPVPATGADDPGIPFVPVATDLVLAMGYCSPVGADQPPQAITVEIWAVPDGAAPILLHATRLEPVHAHALGGLWLPPRNRRVVLDGVDGWPPGRYAIRLGALSYERWLGVEIRDLTLARQESPSPPADP